MKLKSIITFQGTIHPVTFKEFLKEIKVKIWPDNQHSVMYAERNHPGPWNAMPNYNRLTRHNYLRFTRPLLKWLEPSDLTDRLKEEVWPKDELIKMIHDISVRSVCNNGNPTHLIRISPRTWLIANPREFEIHRSNLGITVCNYYPQKSVLVRVEKNYPNPNTAASTSSRST